MQACFEPEQAFSISMSQPVFEISIAYKKKKCITLFLNITFNNLRPKKPILKRDLFWNILAEISRNKVRIIVQFSL